MATMQSTQAGPADAAPPLAGVRVVEFGQYIAVPAAGQLLRDLGADVIKVESASGDPARFGGWSKDDFGPMFMAYNRGKRSVALDLGTSGLKAGAVGLERQRGFFVDADAEDVRLNHDHAEHVVQTTAGDDVLVDGGVL